MATVAILTPTIPGREKKLREALESVWFQTREPDQVIVEEDPERTGAACTRNRALARVETDYIAPLDDDDRLLKNHLEVLMREAEKHPEADVIYPTPKIVGMDDPTAVMIKGRMVLPWGLEWSPEHEIHMRFRGNFIPQTCLMKTSAVREVGGYPEPGHAFYRLSNCEDWGLFRELVKAKKKFHHINVKTWVWEKWDGHTGGQGDR